MRFNCHGKPIFDERFQEAINKWAKAKGDDILKEIKAYGWKTDYEKAKNEIINNPKGRKNKLPLNTSVFEEAEIIEQVPHETTLKTQAVPNIVPL